jgi:Tol biopolymer transport system component
VGLALGVAVLLSGVASAAGVPGKIVFDARPNDPSAIGWQLYSANADGTGLRRLTHHDGDVSPSWSPDGSQILFARVSDCAHGGCSQIWRVNADGGGLQLMLPGNGLEASPAWSPHGDRFAYVQDNNIWIADSSGRNPHKLTSGAAEDAEPAWSPDGRTIAFSRKPGNANAELFVVSADGGTPRKLTHTRSADEYHPSWSPNGRQLAFWIRTFADSVAVMNADGSGRRIVARSALMPCWLPDGTKIVFMREVDSLEEEQVWEVRPDGTGARRVVRGAFTEPEDPACWG